jgi:hypothetical protein
MWDDQLGARISDAEVAEVQYTAFASKKDQAIAADADIHPKSADA